VKFIVGRHKEDPNAVYAGAVYYLKLAGLLLSGWQLARSMVVAVKNFDQDSSYYSAKLATGQFFAKHLLPETQALHTAIVGSNGREAYLSPEVRYF
jgi:hypothetical protein